MSKSSRARAHVKERERAQAAGLTIRQYRKLASERGIRRSASKYHKTTRSVPAAIKRAYVNLLASGMPRRESVRALNRYLEPRITQAQGRTIARQYHMRGSRWVGHPASKGGVWLIDRFGDRRLTFHNLYRRSRDVSIREEGSAQRRNEQYALGYLRYQPIGKAEEKYLTGDYTNWYYGRTHEGSP